MVSVRQFYYGIVYRPSVKHVFASICGVQDRGYPVKTLLLPYRPGIVYEGIVMQLQFGTT